MVSFCFSKKIFKTLQGSYTCFICPLKSKITKFGNILWHPWLHCARLCYFKILIILFLIERLWPELISGVFRILFVHLIDH